MFIRDKSKNERNTNCLTLADNSFTQYVAWHRVEYLTFILHFFKKETFCCASLFPPNPVRVACGM